jgi:hypothetical protein
VKTGDILRVWGATAGSPLEEDAACMVFFLEMRSDANDRSGRDNR